MTSKLFVLAAAALAPVAAISAAAPTQGPPTLVQIIRGLEKEGYGPIVEVSLDDGAWEVEAYRNDAPLELTVNAKTGKIESEHRDDADARPPKGALKLSEVLRKLEKAGHDDIDEVSFERRYWEVESRVDRKSHELHVDPKTAEIVSDRIDD